jgi:lipoate-protein ligase B
MRRRLQGSRAWLGRRLSRLPVSRFPRVIAFGMSTFTFPPLGAWGCLGLSMKTIYKKYQGFVTPPLIPPQGGNTPWYFVNLPVTDYGTVKDLQNRLVSAKIAGNIEEEVVIWVEHFPVFTIGRHCGKENLMVSEDFLLEQKILLIAAERGGDITYHGPGQLVAYPIVNFQKKGLSVTEYVRLLEQVMILTSHEFSVQASRNPVNPGIFIGNRKLGSVGIAIRHGISFHGFALNVDIALEPFQWIHPCGLRDIKITSLYQENGFPMNLKTVRQSAQKHFCTLFGVEPAQIELSELEKMV